VTTTDACVVGGAAGGCVVAVELPCWALGWTTGVVVTGCAGGTVGSIDTCCPVGLSAWVESVEPRMVLPNEDPAVTVVVVASAVSVQAGFARARAEVRPSTAVAVKPIARMRADDAGWLDFLCSCPMISRHPLLRDLHDLRHPRDLHGLRLRRDLRSRPDHRRHRRTTAVVAQSAVR